jgi:hypothetical protein
MSLAKLCAWIVEKHDDVSRIAERLQNVTDAERLEERLVTAKLEEIRFVPRRGDRPEHAQDKIRRLVLYPAELGRLAASISTKNQVLMRS